VYMRLFIDSCANAAPCEAALAVEKVQLHLQNARAIK